MTDPDRVRRGSYGTDLKSQDIGMGRRQGLLDERTGNQNKARMTVREPRYAEALRGSRAARTRSRPKTNSSAGS